MSESRVGRFWLTLPWAILACGIPLLVWWMVEPVPVDITYVAPSFLSQPVTSRDEASRYYISEIPGGQTAWRYVEFCVHRVYEGTSHRAFVGEALVWHAPDLPTQFSREKGCAAISVATPIPQSSPTRSFQFVQTMTIPLNPLRTETIAYPPIPITILDTKGQ